MVHRLVLLVKPLILQPGVVCPIELTVGLHLLRDPQVARPDVLHFDVPQSGDFNDDQQPERDGCLPCDAVVGYLGGRPDEDVGPGTWTSAGLSAVDTRGLTKGIIQSDGETDNESPRLSIVRTEIGHPGKDGRRGSEGEVGGEV